MSDDELNFAREVLRGQGRRDLTDDQVLVRSRELLEGWMDGERRMQRPKLYDHYALVLVALLRKVESLEARVEELEGRCTGG